MDIFSGKTIQWNLITHECLEALPIIIFSVFYVISLVKPIFCWACLAYKLFFNECLILYDFSVSLIIVNSCDLIKIIEDSHLFLYLSSSIRSAMFPYSLTPLIELKRRLKLSLFYYSFFQFLKKKYDTDAIFMINFKNSVPWKSFKR